MKVKPKRLNFNGNKYNNFKKREITLIAKIDKSKKKPKTAERDIIEYPDDINETGRVWSF